MKPELREEFREQLIALLGTKAGFGMTLAQLKVHARTLGFAGVSEEEFRAELDYLIGKGFVATVDKEISPEIPRWKITAAGRDFAATRGLDQS